MTKLLNNKGEEIQFDILNKSGCQNELIELYMTLYRKCDYRKLKRGKR
ncbi:hypothetical protein [Bacillus luti]|nr:hypothetical protein [Bacillus luti]HDR4564093.1 hypothetical protein [Bacillus luti]